MNVVPEKARVKDAEIGEFIGTRQLIFLLDCENTTEGEG
jgi:hypothetical protein